MPETSLKPDEFKCPKCGVPNKQNALFCQLCQAVFGEGKKAEKLQQKFRKRTDFYKQITSNKRKSLLLIFFLALFLCGVGFIFGEAYYPGRGGFCGVAAAGILTLILSSIAFFKGDSIVLSMCGAREASDKKDRRLVNVVEEMAIASGLPMPRVYVIEDGAMNAFAAGRDPKHSVVAVTRGLLDNLNREELQAVVGHEMGHIRNFDIRFAMLIAVMVGVISIMSHFFLRGMQLSTGRSRGSGRGRGNAVQAVFILIGIILAIIAPILATIIQMAISRQREFMADSSSVEFTRNPRGLISALRKLSDSSVKIEGAVKATQHMFFVNPFRNFGERSSNLFSTHPPIESRIKVLESMVV